jgi:4-amino-4-deoxy-L-arabinose transferase-like glycosyltransferase
VVYELTSKLPENWRYYALRWYTLAIGAALFWVARKFSLEYFNGKSGPALATTAAFMLAPVTMRYYSHINVDSASVLLSSACLWMAMRVARGTATARDRAGLGILLGLGLLTKVTIFAAFIAAMFAHVVDRGVTPEKRWEQRRLRLLTTFVIAGAISVWWYARSAQLSGHAVQHTFNNLGSGLDLAGIADWKPVLWVTLRETYLSSWAQRGWLPPGIVEIVLYALLSALILFAVFGGFARRKERAADPAPLLCGLFVIVLILAHQYQVWFVDFGWNAGGRYILNGLLAVCALIVGSLYGLRGRRIWLTAFVGILLAMDLVSANRIWTTLNPMYAPGWKAFQFPSDYDPTYRLGRDQLQLAHPPPPSESQ